MTSGYVKYKWIIQIVDTYRQIIFIFSYNYKCFCGFRFHWLVRRRNVSWSHFMILLNVFIGKSLFFDIVKADSHLIAAFKFFLFIIKILTFSFTKHIKSSNPYDSFSRNVDLVSGFLSLSLSQHFVYDLHLAEF